MAEIEGNLIREVAGLLVQLQTRETNIGDRMTEIRASLSSAVGQMQQDLGQLQGLANQTAEDMKEDLESKVPCCNLFVGLPLDCLLAEARKVHLACSVIEKGRGDELLINK